MIVGMNKIFHSRKPINVLLTQVIGSIASLSTSHITDFIVVGISSCEKIELYIVYSIHTL